jgi:8-oxo-dGTP pyrophosphatase MutT (NUDIX family)
MLGGIFSLLLNKNKMEQEQNPWKTISGKIVYDNPWINLTEYQVMTPANTPGIYGKIHFKNIAVGIIALDEQGNTYLVGQYRFPLNEYSWEIPEGGCPEGTDILTSAKRELKEETGFEANQWTELLRMYLSNSVSDEYVVVFIAQDLVAGEAEPEDTEKLAIKKLPFATAMEWVMEGKITDSITVAAILKWQLLQSKTLLK